MLLVALMMLIKTFFYLRIFKELSFLVSMLKQVFYDLKVFLSFYCILIFMFALILAILDLGNFEFSDDPVIRNVPNTPTGPGKEYNHVNKFLAHVITIIRISIGDFDFGASTYLEPFQNIIYWVTWIIIVTATCIVFLNFIIAEVSASYEKVKNTLDVTILQERGQLINESEDMLRARFGKQITEWTHLFPKYIITRELDD